MRHAWTFFAGAAFAGFVMLVSLPLWGGLVLAAWLARGELWTMLDGQSHFAVREDGGHMTADVTNVSFHTLSVPVQGEPRHRRLLVRLEVRGGEMFAAGHSPGRVRLDAWPLGTPADLRQPPLYTIVAPGTDAQLDEEGMLMVSRGTRRSAYALSTGSWLFDADTPAAVFTGDGDQRRMVALGAAEEDLPPGAIAVVTYASSTKSIRRVLLTASDPTRGRLLRTSVGMTRPVTRLEMDGTRSLDISLPAGMVRIPIRADDLDLAAASLPVGLSLLELKPWGKQGGVASAR